MSLGCCIVILTVRLKRTIDPETVVIRIQQAIGLGFLDGAVEAWYIVTTAFLTTWWEQPPRDPETGCLSGVISLAFGFVRIVAQKVPKWRMAIGHIPERSFLGDQRLDGITMYTGLSGVNHRCVRECLASGNGHKDENAQSLH